MALLAAYSFDKPKGINTGVPSSKIDRMEVAFSQNFNFYEGHLQQTGYKFPVPNSGTPDGNPVLATYYFEDYMNNTHLGAITSHNIYDGISATSWGTGYALPANSPNGVTSYQIFQNRLFIVNGSTYVMYWDGVAGSVSTATNAYGGNYLFELASSLVIAYTNESTGGVFPQRVRWCEAGVITAWDPSLYVGAGFEDLLECPDGITGVMNTSPVAYIVRTNGISQMIPTGIGTAPFSFNHLWASQNGIGNVFPKTVANFGVVGFVVAEDDIYVITSSSYERIGGKIKNTLYNQLINTRSGSSVISWVETVISKGLPYLRYRIGYNLFSGITPFAIAVWSFSTETNGWEYELIEIQSETFVLTGRPTSLPGFNSPGNLAGQVLIPYYDGTINSLMQTVAPAQGTTFFPASIEFKTEYNQQLETTSVRRVLIRYQYLGGVVPTTIQLNGMFGSSTPVTLNLGDTTQSKQYYGGFPPPVTIGNYYWASFSGSLLTDVEWQVALSLAVPLDSNTNSIRITDVWALGDVGKEIPL